MSDVNPLPLFPLPLVLFPGESLPLHIFEPRYIEMVNECIRDGHPFGIVSMMNNRVSKVGCTYKINEVTTTYNDGRLDIKGTGVDRFLVHNFTTNRAFLQGSVMYFHDMVQEEHSDTIERIFDDLKPMFSEIIGLAREEIASHPVEIPVNSFQFAHYIGFEMSQKQNLLEIKSEYERLVFIKHHLDIVLPKLRAFEDTKTRIRNNGHFREFPPVHFKIDTDS